ncbi:hypothetical protein TSUD_252510 [Trifolium subterraneum]|nr:hypothetical protein TSUD_252510 [Trifolium subterraneum]
MSGGIQSSLRKALGALKDTTTVPLAKVNSDYWEKMVKICCIGVAYLGGPTMVVIALKCPEIEQCLWPGTNVKIVVAPSHIVVLTPKTFNEVVLHETKNVLVKFYAPWCGLCKSLAPIYEKVAATFKSEDEVVIVNLDADKYRDLVEKYGLSGFLTLKPFPEGSKVGEDYGGGRDLDGGRIQILLLFKGA